jgi:hypothetical protein
MNAAHPSTPTALLEPTSGLRDYLISYRLITSAGGIVVAGQRAHHPKSLLSFHKQQYVL